MKYWFRISDYKKAFPNYPFIPLDQLDNGRFIIIKNYNAINTLIKHGVFPVKVELL